MNNVLNSFGFKISGKTKKSKRTKEGAFGFKADGFCVCSESYLPEERNERIKAMFSGCPEIEFINLKPLRGRTILIKRNKN